MILYFCFYFAFNATKICQRCVKIPGWHENKLLYQKESCWSRESACAREKEVARERERQRVRERGQTHHQLHASKSMQFSVRWHFFSLKFCYSCHTQRQQIAWDSQFVAKRGKKESRVRVPKHNSHNKTIVKIKCGIWKRMLDEKHEY